MELPTLSVKSLFAERDQRRQREKEAEDALLRKKEEELTAFRRRLDEFQLTDEHIHRVTYRIRRAFERGETELMLTSFPSAFCTDDGRAIINAGVPAINRQAQSDEPAWLSTIPKGGRPIYEYWYKHLRPGGFRFSARVINFPDGKPGDVGLFFAWPKSSADLQ